MKAEGRMIDAIGWLRRRTQQNPKSLIQSYSKRYNVTEDVAFWELAAIGFHDKVRIELYERDGIEWEYKVDGSTSDLKVVPKGTAEWELFSF